MNLYSIYIVVPVLILLAPIAHSVDLPDILSDQIAAGSHYLPDFSYAGYANGMRLPPVSSGRVIEVGVHGAEPDDGVDDSRAVLAAISAANAIHGPVILRFEPGRYRITEVIRVERGEIVLQGAGSGIGGTVLEFSRPLAQVDTGTSLDELRQYIRKFEKRQVKQDANINEYFSEYSWSGGFIWIQRRGTRPAPYLPNYDPPIRTLGEIASGRRGEETVRLNTAADIEPGGVVQIHWTNRDGPDSALIDAIYNDSEIAVGSHHWTFPERPMVRQTSRVVAVNGQEITLSDPLLHDVNDSIPASIAEWPHLERIGIEDLHLEFPEAPYFGHHMERGYNGIYLTSAFDSWVRNVRISNADSGILTYNSANITIADVTTDGDRRAHYGVHMGNVHNVLAERISVFNPVRHSLTFNTQSTKCVYKDSQVHVTPALDQHAGANHQNLFDNVTIFVNARRTADGPAVKVFDGSGADYWQPGHGAFNTTWNLRVYVESGAYSEEIVTILGIDEGPFARIVGLHGNRQFRLDYRPNPYIERLNTELISVPSLYDYQLLKRKGVTASNQERVQTTECLCQL